MGALTLKEDYKMQERTNFSGNLKLRLPQSLHYALANRAEKEGISLNQLCLMYLSASLTEHYLGAEQFNRRLEKIEISSGSNEEKLFEELQRLNDDVEALKPLLFKELKEIFEKNIRSINDQMEALSYIYPIYYGKSKFPYIKTPSAKVVLRPYCSQYVDYKEVAQLVGSIPDISVAYGDFDYYIPIEQREIDRTRVMSIAINLYCRFNDLFDEVRKIKEILRNAEYENKAQLLVKPCYMYIDTEYYLKEI